MLYGRPPVAVTQIDLDWDEFMHWLYLPVKMPKDRTVTLPPNLEFLRPIVSCALLDQLLNGVDLTDRYVYVTARHGFASPDNPLNRPGWHCDGFGTDDINYIWWDRFPTRFATHPFEGISDDHIESMAQFEEQAVADPDGTYPDKTLYYLDPYVVHTTPDVPAPGGLRSFLKVSISPHRYNLVGNSHNYGLDYNWEMYPRDLLRNDPHRYGKDFYV